MSSITIEIPENITRSAKIPAKEMNIRFKKELAIRLYEQGILNFGKARALAGLTKWQFHRLLGKENILRNYDIEDLHTDLKTLENLD
jgi:predicted HTH domain antitoxin